MKIIQLILGKGNPERMNGVNKVVHSLATTLHSLNVDVEVWGITPNIDTGEMPETPFVTRLFRTCKNHFKLDASLIHSIIHSSDEVVFHLHGAFIPEFFTVSKLLKSHHIPSVMTPHGSFNQYALRKSFLRKFIYYLLCEGVLIKNVNHIHLLGRNERSYITNCTPEDKLIVVPNGQHINEEEADLVPMRSDRFVLGFMGRIDIRHKGLDFMLEGFAHYRHTLQGKGQLWLLGDGEDMPKVETMIRQLDIADCCVLYGSKYGEEKLQLMNEFNVFLHTSRYEGVPMSVLECSLIGIPSIVSSATNVKEEVIEYHAGIGLDNVEKETIAEAMKEMEVHNEKRTIVNMQHNAQRMVHEIYNWDKIALRFLEYYQDLLK